MPRTGGNKVLVVDDEGPIRGLLRAVLVGMGLEVVEAASGEQGLDVAGAEGPFALVVSDLVMPGIDGLEMARRLAVNGRGRRFLFISGFYDIDEIGWRLEGMPTSAFLEKPFSVPDLVRTVRGLLNEGTPRAAA